LIYKKGVVREAADDEIKKIEAEYKAGTLSKTGVLLNFESYTKTRLIRHYFAQAYSVQLANNTMTGIASALLYKIHDLRKLFGKKEVQSAIDQAKAVVKAFRRGKAAMTDSLDDLAQQKGDSDTTIATAENIYAELAGLLMISQFFITGKPTTGASVIGDADINLSEPGVKIFFVSVFKRVVDRLYGIKISFVSQKWRMFASLSSALIILENSKSVSRYEVRQFAMNALGLDVSKEQKKEMDILKEEVPILQTDGQLDDDDDDDEDDEEFKVRKDGDVVKREETE